MICYLVCSPAMYIVEKYSTYKEASERLSYLRLPGYHIFEARLIESIQ
jgi:hypothetical protein